MGPLKSGMEVTVLITHNSLQHRCEAGGVCFQSQMEKNKELVVKVWNNYFNKMLLGSQLSLSLPFNGFHRRQGLSPQVRRADVWIHPYFWPGVFPLWLGNFESSPPSMIHPPSDGPRYQPCACSWKSCSIQGATGTFLKYICSFITNSEESLEAAADISSKYISGSEMDILSFKNDTLTLCRAIQRPGMMLPNSKQLPLFKAALLIMWICFQKQ